MSESPPLKTPNSSPDKSRILETEERKDSDDADREAERGFSLFMKAGGCTDTFLSLGKCFYEASRINEDAVDRCQNAAADLKECVESNLIYYRPVLSVLEKEEALGQTQKAAPADLNPTSASQEEARSTETKEKEEEQGEDGEEEEGECGFCLFMKGGGCRETFIDWEKCIEEAEKSGEDIVENCFQVTAALKTCMEAHSDYYEPILRAEKAAEEEAVRELEKEADELKKSDQDAPTTEGKGRIRNSLTGMNGRDHDQLWSRKS